MVECWVWLQTRKCSRRRNATTSFFATFHIIIIGLATRYKEIVPFGLRVLILMLLKSSLIKYASALFVRLAAPPLRSIKPSKRGVRSRSRREVHAIIYHIGNNRNWQNTCFAHAPQNQPKKRRKRTRGREGKRERERGAEAEDRLRGSGPDT